MGTLAVAPHSKSMQKPKAQQSILQTSHKMKLFLGVINVHLPIGSMAKTFKLVI